MANDSCLDQDMKIIYSLYALSIYNQVSLIAFDIAVELTVKIVETMLYSNQAFKKAFKAFASFLYNRSLKLFITDIKANIDLTNITF